MTPAVSAAEITRAIAEEAPYQSTKGASDIAGDNVERAVFVVESAFRGEGSGNAHFRAS